MTESSTRKSQQGRHGGSTSRSNSSVGTPAQGPVIKTCTRGQAQATDHLPNQALPTITLTLVMSLPQPSCSYNILKKASSLRPPFWSAIPQMKLSILNMTLHAEFTSFCCRELNLNHRLFLRRECYLGYHITFCRRSGVRDTHNVIMVPEYYSFANSRLDKGLLRLV